MLQVIDSAAAVATAIGTLGLFIATVVMVSRRRDGR